MEVLTLGQKKENSGFYKNNRQIRELNKELLTGEHTLHTYGWLTAFTLEKKKKTAHVFSLKSSVTSLIKSYQKRERDRQTIDLLHVSWL